MQDRSDADGGPVKAPSEVFDSWAASGDDDFFDEAMRRSHQAHVPLTDDDCADLAERLKGVADSIRRSVRSGRDGLGMSQAALAKELSRIGLHLDASAITRIESGQRAVRADEAWALAAVLRQDLAVLIPDSTSLWSIEERLEFTRERVEWGRRELRRTERSLRELEAELEALEAKTRGERP